MSLPTPQEVLAAEADLVSALAHKTNRTATENELLMNAGELITDLAKEIGPNA